MKQLTFTWSIKRAVVNIDEIEDQNTLESLLRVKQLVCEKKYTEAIEALPAMSFYWTLDQTASYVDIAKCFQQQVYDFVLEDHHLETIRVGLENNKLSLSVSVVFDVEIQDGVSLEKINDWLWQSGAWMSSIVSGNWNYLEDDGGHFEALAVRRN